MARRSTGSIPNTTAAPTGRTTGRPPLERLTLTTATMRAIRDRILTGAYAEGEPLRQDTIASELGVSTIPVREALRQLEVEGLVTFQPHRGAVVSTSSIAEIEELFELRACIESELLLLAVPALGASDFELIEEILDSYETAFQHDDVAAWGNLNRQLHVALLVRANRPLTLGIAENLHSHSDRYARMQLALTHGQARANQEHRAIVAAARRREKEHASQLLQEHILAAGRSLVKFLQEHRGQRAE
ncbi:MAG TPA: GntR family transcriptional regulator [Gemmatimonadaceae bacterium]